MARKPALTQFIEREFGGAFRVQVSVVNVDAAVVKLVDHNFERMALTFIQLGPNTLNILTDDSVSNTRGIKLVGSGAADSLNARDDLVLVGWEWFGVGSVGGQSVLIVEVIRVAESTP